MPVLKLEGKITTDAGKTEFEIEGRNWIQNGDESVAYVNMEYIRELVQFLEEVNSIEMKGEVTDGDGVPIKDNSEQFILIGAWVCPNCGSFFKQDPGPHTAAKKPKHLTCPACGYKAQCTIPKEICI